MILQLQRISLFSQVTLLSKFLFGKWTILAETDQETRTRAQRDASLKEGISVFNQHVRNINKVTRRIYSLSSRANVEANELDDCVNEYESILEDLSSVYDKICGLSFDSPPQKVVDSFERIDSESCKFLSETTNRIREINEQVKANRSQ